MVFRKIRTPSSPTWRRRVLRRSRSFHRSNRPDPSFGRSATSLERRVQLPTGSRHVRSRKAHQSNASDVDPFRKLPHHRASHIHVDVSPGGRTGASGGTGAGTSVDRTTSYNGRNVLSPLLDVAGLAAATVVALRGSFSGPEAGNSQLLDEHLLVRLGGGVRRSAGDRCMAAAAAKTRSGRCRTNGPRHRNSGEQPSI